MDEAGEKAERWDTISVLAWIVNREEGALWDASKRHAAWGFLPFLSGPGGGNSFGGTPATVEENSAAQLSLQQALAAGALSCLGYEGQPGEPATARRRLSPSMFAGRQFVRVGSEAFAFKRAASRRHPRLHLFLCGLEFLPSEVRQRWTPEAAATVPAEISPATKELLEQKNKGGSPAKYDWPALREVFQAEVVRRGGLPDPLNEEGWQTQADAAHFIMAQAKRGGRKEPGFSTAKAKAAAWSREIETEAGNG